MRTVRPTARVEGDDALINSTRTGHVPVRYLVALGVVVSMLSIAWGFSGIEGELRLRDRGLAFNESDLALDAAVASRSHLGEAVRIVALGGDLTGADLVRVQETALDLVDESLVEVEVRAALIDERQPSRAVGALAAEYRASAVAVAAALRNGDLGTADALLVRNLEPSYESLVDVLAGLRADSLAAFTGIGTSRYVLSVATRFLLAVAVPLIAIVVIFDSLRRRHRQKELELDLKAERDLGRVKDEFIANVSHELRTPLTIVHGFATVLGEEGGLPDHVADAAAYIARESDELTRMVDDLLTAARTDAGALTIRVEPVPVREAVAAVLDGLGRDGKGIEADVERAYVFADALRLRQIIRNLLSNARRHGGPSIRITGAVDRDEYVIVVADDGPGVDPVIEAHVFDRFVHGSAENLLAGSVGLGLAIVESLASRMNGSVAYDRVGDETRFTVRVPLSPVGYALQENQLVVGDPEEAT